jgi:hypothetical protein
MKTKVASMVGILAKLMCEVFAGHEEYLGATPD